MSVGWQDAPDPQPLLSAAAMNTLVSPRTRILLDAEADGTVTVVPPDKDRFVVSQGEAARACTLYEKAVKRCESQVNELLAVLHGWLQDRRDKIRTAYATFQASDSPLLLIVQKEVRYDAQLSDDLTELDIQVANDPRFDLLDFNVLAIPAVSRETAATFLSSGQVFTHAD